MSKTLRCKLPDGSVRRLKVDFVKDSLNTVKALLELPHPPELVFASLTNTRLPDTASDRVDVAVDLPEHEDVPLATFAPKVFARLALSLAIPRRTVEEQLADCIARNIVSFVLHPPGSGTRGLKPQAALNPPAPDYRFEVPEADTVGALQARVATKWRSMFKTSHRPTPDQIELTPRLISRVDLDRWRHPERPLTGDLGGPQLELDNKRLNMELDVDVKPPSVPPAVAGAAGVASSPASMPSTATAAAAQHDARPWGTPAVAAGNPLTGTGVVAAAAAPMSGAGGTGDEDEVIDDAWAEATREGVVDDGDAPDDAPVDASQLDLPEGDKPPASVRTMGELRAWMQKHQMALGFQRIGRTRTVKVNLRSFQNQTLRTRRFAWLYGTVAGARDRPDLVQVEAVYEPRQLGFERRMLLLQDDESKRQQQWAERIAGNLGLELVGCIMSAPYREEGDSPLTASEVCFATKQQQERPFFTTLVFQYENVRGVGGEVKSTFRYTAAYQVSDQGMQLQRAGHLGLPRSSTPEARNEFMIRSQKPVIATKPGDLANRVLTTQHFDCAYLVTPVGIQDLLPYECMLRQYFPVMSRRDEDGVETMPSIQQCRRSVFPVDDRSHRVAGNLAAMWLRRQGSSGLQDEAAVTGEGGVMGLMRESMLQRCRDLNLLLYLATAGNGRLLYGVTFAEEEIDELCGYVRNGDNSGCASFQHKLLLGFGRGFLDTIAEQGFGSDGSGGVDAALAAVGHEAASYASGGFEDIRPTFAQFLEHVERVYSTNRTKTTNPCRSIAQTTRSGRERRLHCLVDDLHKIKDRWIQLDEEAATRRGIDL